MNIKELKKEADKKSVDAQTLLARAYRTGNCVPCDNKKANKLFEKASKKGSVSASEFLGYAYASGVGVGVNFKKAEKFYSKASKENSPIADFSLATLFNNGSLGKHKESKGAFYLEKAKESNFAATLYQEAIELELGAEKILNDIMAELEEKKETVEMKARSLKLFSESARLGCPEAIVSLGIKTLLGDGIAKNYGKARKAFEKGVKSNVTAAKYCLGYMYENGYGVEKNYKTAYDFYKQAHQDGMLEGTIAVATCYLTGFGCEKKCSLAVKYFKNAQERGCKDANYYLGLCALNGYGMSKNMKEATKYFSSADSAKAYTYLGRINDVYVGGDKKKGKLAFKYYQKAVELGDVDANVGLGRCYRHGMGVKADVDFGNVYLMDAANTGNTEAILLLAEGYQSNKLGFVTDLNRAVALITKAAEKGNVDAAKRLEKAYKNGELGLKADKQKEWEWLVKRASSGDVTAYFALAEAYTKGIKKGKFTVAKDGMLGAFWCAMTSTYGEKTSEREKASNMLSNFACDGEHHWGFKKEIAQLIKKNKKENKKKLAEEKANKKVKKEVEAPVPEKIIDKINTDSLLDPIVIAPVQPVVAPVQNEEVQANAEQPATPIKESKKDKKKREQEEAELLKQQLEEKKKQEKLDKKNKNNKKGSKEEKEAEEKLLMDISVGDQPIDTSKDETADKKEA